MSHTAGFRASARHRLVALVGVFAVAVSLLMAIPATPVQSAVQKPSDMLPDYGALVGATSWPRDGDWSQDGVKRRWEYIEDFVGRDLDIGHFYYDWGANIISWREAYNVQNGRLSLVSWAPTQVGNVNSGQWDNYIEQQADLVKSFDGPILIRWAWEMDGNYRAAQMESPAAFIQAWRRIVQIFRDRDVTNAEFAWCPNAWAFNIDEGPDWYPGDAWVDWICADGYNWNPGRAGDPWISLGEIFEEFHDWAAPRGKPIIIGEFAAQERAPGEKAAWMREIPSELENRLPEIDAIVWFDTPVDYQWWLDTSQSSLEAWADVVNDPYLTDGLVFGDTFSSGLGRWAATVDAGLDQNTGVPAAPSLKLESDGSSSSHVKAKFATPHDAVCVDLALRIKDREEGAAMPIARIQNSGTTHLARLFVKASGQLMVESSRSDKRRKVGVELDEFRWYDVEFCVTRGGPDGNIAVAVDGDTLLDWDTPVATQKVKELKLGGNSSAFKIRIDDVGVALR